MAQFTYSGHPTFFSVDPEAEGGDPEDVRLLPGTNEIPDRALKMPYVKRLKRQGVLTEIKTPNTSNVTPSISTSRRNEGAS